MNAFSNSRLVEARSLMILQPFLRERSQDGALVFIEKGPLAKSLQQTIGDAVMTDKNGGFRSVEIKAERENRHGNLFLEIWSNRNLEDRVSHAKVGSNPGWMIKLRADLLLYHFINNDELYVIDFFRLKRWAFRDRRIFSFPERGETQSSQRNDTWGRCVPIETLVREVGAKLFRPLELQGLNASDFCFEWEAA